MKKFLLLVITAFSIGMNSQTSAPPMVRLHINTINFNDETVFYFLQGGTTGFQPAFDAYKLIFNPGANPYIGSMSDSILTSISGLPELPVNLSIPVKAITPVTKTFTFSSETSDFPDDVCVKLYDSFTGISTDILTSEYVCTLYDTTSSARFKMNFFSGSIEANSVVKQADCSSKTGNMIAVSGENNRALNYEWKYGNTVVKTSLNKCSADSLSDIPGGNYTVKISDAEGCGSFTKSFVLDNVVATTASFSSDATTTLSKEGFISFKNSSKNAQFSSWTFGDNSGTFYVPEPSHNYLAPGVYTVTLYTESITHCKDQTQQVIRVINDITGISKSDTNSDVRLAALSQGNYELNMSFNQSTDITVSLFDLKGTLLKTKNLQGVVNTKENIDFTSLSQGMYLVKVNTSYGEKTFKIIN